MKDAKWKYLHVDITIKTAIIAHLIATVDRSCRQNVLIMHSA